MKAYSHRLKEERIFQSMSRKGNCLDNSVMENFFGLLKQEIYYGIVDILVSRNPDSGNMETGIPERKPPLIGLINTHKESKKCQVQSRFAGHKPALHL